MSSIDDLRHEHYFLGDAHEHNERKTWIVIGITTTMMVTEIVGGIWFGSVALIADGLHMSTHAGAMLIAALAYAYSRSHAGDPRFSFGTGKLGDLAGFTSAVILAMIALLIGYEAVSRLFASTWTSALPIANFAVCTFGTAAGCAFRPSVGAMSRTLWLMRLVDERSRRVCSQPP